MRSRPGNHVMEFNGKQQARETFIDEFLQRCYVTPIHLRFIGLCSVWFHKLKLNCAEMRLLPAR